MATLNELRGQRGVRVYSPQGIRRPQPQAPQTGGTVRAQARRPGGTADAGTASRVRQGGQQQQPVERVDPLLGAVRQRRMSSGGQPGGGGGNSGGGLGNLVNMALKPLELLSIPKNAVQVGMTELAGMLPENVEAGLAQGPLGPMFQTFVRNIDEQSVEEDPRSNWEKIGDPSYGWGDIAYQSGNKWADRFQGLMGDIALDPLTYVAGSSAISGANRAARTGMASRAIAEGFSEEIAQRLGRYGATGVDDATRAALREAGVNVAQSGYRFAGQRLPFTGGIDRAIGGTIAHTKAAINDLPGMSRLRAWRTPEGLEAATEKLITGRGHMSVTEASEVINFTRANTKAGNTVRSTMARQAEQIARNVRDPDIVHTAEREGGTVINQFFDAAAERADRAGIRIHRRKNYVPHHLTQRAADFMKTDQAAPFRQAFDFNINDIDDPSPFLLERKMVARTKPYEIAGKTLTVTDDTISGWNTAFREAFPELGFDLFDDNFSSIAARYTVGLSENVGEMEALRTLLHSKSGLTRRWDDDGAFDEVIDEIKTTTANDAAGAQLKNMQRAYKDSLARMREDTRRGVAGIQGILKVQMQEAIDETELLPEAKSALQKLLNEEESLQRARGSRRAAGEIGPPKPTKLERALDNEVFAVDKRLDEIDDEMASIQRRYALHAEIVSEAREEAKQARALMPEEMQARLRELTEARVTANMDRATLVSIRERAQLANLKSDIIERNLGSDSFVSLAAGVKEPVYPASPPGVARQEVGGIPYEGTMVPTNEATIAGVRADYNGRRARLMDRFGPARDLSADISVRSQALSDAEERYARMQARAKPVIEELREKLQIQKNRESILRARLAEAEGWPSAFAERTKIRGELTELRSGPLREAEDAYNAAMQPLRQVKAEVTFEERTLAGLKKRQEDIARQLPAPAPADVSGEIAVARDAARQEEAALRQMEADLNPQLQAARSKVAEQDQKITAAREKLRAAQSPEIIATGEALEVVRSQERRLQGRLDALETGRIRLPGEVEEIADIKKKLAALRRGPLKQAKANYDATVKGKGLVSPKQFTDRLRRMQEARDRANQVVADITNQIEVQRGRWHAAQRQADRLQSTMETRSRSVLDEQLQTLAEQEADALARASKGTAFQMDWKPLEPTHERRTRLVPRRNEDEQVLATIELSRKPYGIPKDEAARKAIMEGKMPPGGTGDLVGRARANLEAGNMALAHGDSLVLSGAIVDEDMIPLREQIAELERHVQEYGGVVLEDGAIVRPAPSAARRERMEQLTRQVGRYSEFIYRYKAALEAGLEPSDDLGAAILMRIAEHEDRVVQSQIRTLQGYLKKGQTEAYGQYEIQQLKDQHRLELQKAIIDNPANNEATIKKARRKYNDIKRRMAERPEPPMLSIMNDDVEQTVAAVRDMIIELDNAVTNYNDARYMTKRLSWPREEQARLRENIDRFGGEFEKAKATQRRRKAAIVRARNSGKQNVRYTDFNGEMVTETMAQAELAVQGADAGMLQMAATVDNARLKLSVLDGSAGDELSQLVLRINDQRNPPNIDRLVQQQEFWKNKAQAEGLTSSEEASLAFVEQRIGALRQPLNQGELEQLIARKDRVQRAVDSMKEVLGADVDRINAISDDGAAFIRGLIERGPEEITHKELQTLRDLLGPEQAEYAQSWIVAVNQALGPKVADRTDFLAGNIDAISRVMAELEDRMGDSDLMRNIVGRAIDSGDLNVTYDQLYNALTASARTRLQETQRNFGEMFDRMGLEVVQGFDGAMKLQSLGYRMSRQSLNENDLRAAVIRSFEKKGWDPTRTIEHKIQDLTMEQQRLRTIQRGLGKELRYQKIDPATYAIGADAPAAAFRRTPEEMGSGVTKEAKAAAVRGDVGAKQAAGRDAARAAAFQGDMSGRVTMDYRAVLRGENPWRGSETVGLKTRNQQMIQEGEAIGGAREALAGRGAVAREAADEANQALAGAEARVASSEQRVGAAEAGMEDIDPDVAELDSMLNQVRSDEATKTKALQMEAANLAVRKLRAQDAYTAGLRDIDESLSKVREQVPAAIDNVASLQLLKSQVMGAFKKLPKTYKNEDLKVLLGDIRALNESRRAALPMAAGPGGVQVDMADIDAVDALLNVAADYEMRLREGALMDSEISKQLDVFKKGGKIVEDTLVRQIKDGWEPMAQRLLKDEDRVVMAETLATALRNMRGEAATGNVWKAIEKYTTFFKTYATATPGFHLRNAMSGVFMNVVAGVGMASQMRALPLWRQFREDPVRFMETTDPQTRDAFMAVFGSGAGGQFWEKGQGGLGKGNLVSTGRAYQAVMNNALTRFNRRLGEWVEGPMRLGMALDTLQKGGDGMAAMERITKYHFNYGEVSNMDRKMRRLIPFWTFMSRNLPLQIESMWTKPRAYAQYQSLVRNFSEDPDPDTPEYWLAQGAFNTGLELGGADLYAAPDLPHTRILEDVQALGQGRPEKLLSHINPLFRAPVESFAANKKFYSGAPIEPNVFEPLSVPMAAVAPLMMPFGAVSEGGTSGKPVVDERYANVARELLPTLRLLERLMPAEEGTPRSGREMETWGRMMGAPILQLTDELKEQTRRGRVYETRDKQDRRRNLAAS
jgi:hypothetical protein